MRASSPLVDLDPAGATAAPLQQSRARAAARPLTFVQRDEIGVQFGDEFVSPRDGLVSQLIDLGARLVARPLGIGQLGLQLVDLRQPAGLLALQLLAALHDLQQRVLQARTGAAAASPARVAAR